MMKSVHAVIGAGYGDEGKGLMTDFLARQFTIGQTHAPLVVRGNGGAQAGHTVVTADGRRFVFGHHGSGTFAGSETFLASNFIANPLVFRQQHARLRTAAGNGQRLPAVTASASCRVTTIYDMAINSIMEVSRGGGRHGSCGMGINETVTRHDAGFQVRLADVVYPSKHHLAELLREIRTEWVPARTAELRPTPETQRYFDVLANDDYAALADDMQRAMGNLRSEQLLVGDGWAQSGTDQEIVYESAQGLGLDEFLGAFPHVTRSVTGLPSAIRAASECGRTEVQPVYVTRCYKTRHGAGPLTDDGLAFCDRSVVDRTNVDNPWQGTLRYAPLNVGELLDAIDRDMRRSRDVAAAFGITVLPPKLAVTCLDQVGDSVTVRGVDGALVHVKPDELSRLLTGVANLSESQPQVAYESWGPTADGIMELQAGDSA